MSFPTIPKIAPSINLSRKQVINLLLASIAFEELGLAHIINAEGEKIQASLGLIPCLHVNAPSFGGLLAINRDVRRTLQTVIKSQMLLQFKLEEILSLKEEEEKTEPCPPKYIEAGSSWSVGTCCGHDAHCVTLCCCETHKIVELRLEHTRINVGSLHLLCNGNDLTVTYTTNCPFVMDQVHLYVGHVPPPTNNPWMFPYKHAVTSPSACFNTYTFHIDLGLCEWEKIYIAAYAHILKRLD